MHSFIFIVLRCKEIVFAKSIKKPKFRQKALNAVLRKYSHASGHLCFVSCQHERVIVALPDMSRRVFITVASDQMLSKYHLF